MYTCRGISPAKITIYCNEAKCCEAIVSAVASLIWATDCAASWVTELNQRKTVEGLFRQESVVIRQKVPHVTLHRYNRKQLHL